MLVGITTFGADDVQAGMGRYTRSLLHAIAAMADGTDRFEVMVRGDQERKLVPRRPGWKALKTPRFARGNLLNIAWHQGVLPWFCRSRGYDIVLLLAANRRMPWPAFMPLAGCGPVVGVVHDLGALHVPGKYGFVRDQYALRVLAPMMRGLGHVLAISESSKRDIVDFARVPTDKVTVTPLGVDHEIFRPGNSDESRRRIEQQAGISGPYVLYASRLEHPGKNHVRLIRAFMRMKDRLACPHRLVLAGRDWPGCEPIHAAAREAGDAVVLPGFVKEELLPDLYRGAEAFIFPSLHEGFGLPILEAMACGVPVACSNSSSMPEVAGDAALQFDPKDEGAIERTLQELLFDQDTRAWLCKAGLDRAAKFGWERTAQGTIDVLREVVLRYRGRESGRSASANSE